MKTFSVPGLVVAALLLGPALAWSQAFPAKPIRLIVPTPPAGAVDLVARLVGAKLGESMGQPALVENRPNTVAASEAVARSAPDGYTLLAANSTTHVSNLFMLRKLPYHPVRDFTPITAAIDTVACLAVHPSIPAGSVKELVEHARANPGKLTYASSGTGSAFHVAGESFRSLAGIDIVHVPYKGLAPAISDLVGGQVSMAVTALSVALPHARSGKLKLLAIVHDSKPAGMSQTPLLSEVLPGFEKPSLWTGFVGPAGLPAQVTGRLNAEMVKALNAPEVRGKLESLGLEVLAGTPEQFGALMRRDIDSYGRIVKSIGLKPE